MERIGFWKLSDEEYGVLVKNKWYTMFIDEEQEYCIAIGNQNGDGTIEKYPFFVVNPDKVYLSSPSIRNWRPVLEYLIEKFEESNNQKLE